MNLPLRDFADVVAALKGPGGASSAGGENRRAARMTVSAKINVNLIENGKVGRRFTALTRDISISGVGLLQSVALPAKAEVILALPRASQPLFVRSIATHCRVLADGLLTVGVQFMEIVDAAAAQQLIDRDTEERARLQRSILS